MATERLSIRSIKEVLRQKWVLKKSHREVAQSLAISARFVGGLMVRVAKLGLDWEAVKEMSEDELERRLYGPRAAPGAQRPLPDPVYIHNERKKPGVTLELLHLEYLEQHPDGCRYTQFCEHYRAWAAKHRLSMRQVHCAGEKLFVDYSGKKPHLVDPRTGEETEVELFVAVLGASSYTYAEATATQSAPDWIASHERTFRHLEGVPGAVVPDPLKSGVTGPCWYEPSVQRTYEEMASHYGTVVLPARPGKPRDKAKVEAGVQVAQRWRLARLRNQTFFSLAALNERIAEAAQGAQQPADAGVRRQSPGAVREAGQPALRPLPSESFVYGEWKKVRVNIDYHVEVDRHFYSVPHELVQLHEELEARLGAVTVELYRRGERVASHVCSSARGQHPTKPKHIPKAHRAHMEWTPTRMTHWAERIGPKTKEPVEAILAERPPPEMGYRSCLGVLRLAKRYGNERLEAAAARAVAVRARLYRHVDSILKNGLDRLPLPAADEPTAPPISHENVRGGAKGALSSQGGSVKRVDNIAPASLRSDHDGRSE